MRDKCLVEAIVFRSLLLATKGKLCYYSPEEKDRLAEKDTIFSNSVSLSKDPQEIPVEGQIVNNFDFVGHRVCATSVPPSAILKAVMDKMKPNKHGCVPAKP